MNYVLSFVFNPALTRVLLIKKNRPASLAGRWNGIGGKIEQDEQPIDAAHRELFEEAGIRSELLPLIDVELNAESTIFCFYGTAAEFDDYATVTDELVRPAGLGTLHQLPLDVDASWLIQLGVANLKGSHVRQGKIFIHDKEAKE